LSGANVYRAATQAITADEAFAFNDFVDGPLSRLFGPYDAAHHIFHTMLCRLSVALFGVSEFALRIPSLLGGLLYLAAALRISRMAFGAGWLSLLCFALLATNPAVLDYMSAARGYGLALAFLLWALLEAALYFQDRRDSALLRCAIALALAVASNLAFAFPGIALAGIVAMRLAREGKLAEALDRFLLPGLLLAFSIVILPLARAEPGHFYFGARTLMESVESVISIGWVHHSPSLLGSGVEWGRIVVPITLAAAAAVVLRAKENNLGVLVLGTLAGSVALAAAARWIGVLYPLRRTGLYWIPLFLLAMLLALRELWNSRLRFAAAPLLGLALAAQLQFASQLSLRHYSEWASEASNRRVVQEIRRHRETHPKERVTLCAVTWAFEPALNFYRRRYGLDWIEPVDRELKPGRDYYIARPEDWDKMAAFAPRVLYEDPETHVRIGIP
jgi:hypothetical protein